MTNLGGFVMRLTEHFTLAELSRTGTGIPNQPDGHSARRLLYLATYLLQPIRDEWDKLQVTSGFRCAGVNYKVGGSPSSQHLFGEAADIVPLEADIEIVFDWIVTVSGLKFGQAILETRGERRWIHLSLPRLSKPNQEALVYENGVYRP